MDGHLTSLHRSADRTPALRIGILAGCAVGLLQVTSPAVVWWLDPSTVYALELAVIAAIYVGFAVADGRPRVVAVESLVATAFVVVAAVSLTTSLWVFAAGMVGHGLKDWWQHRTGFVRGTRWWPPCCAAVDLVVAGTVAAMLLAEVGAGR